MTGSVLVTVVPGFQAAASTAVAESLFGGSAAVRLILTLLSWAFLAVAITVATATSANAFTVLLDGRLEEIALRRVLGASALDEQRRLARTGSFVGVGGCLSGLGLGGVVVLLAAPAGGSSPWTWSAALVGQVAMVIATRTAIRRATTRVLASTPLSGLRLTRVASSDGLVAPSRPGMFVLGIAILLASVPVSLVSPLAIVLGVLGGVIAMIGSLAATEHVLRAGLVVVGRVVPVAGSIGLAVVLLRSRVADAGRAAAGLFTGTAVVTTFVVSLSSLTATLEASYAGDRNDDVAASALRDVTMTMGALTSLVVVLSGIGLGTALLASIRRRRSEVATLRILGQSSREARATIAAEAAVLVALAVVPGLALGSLAGWVATQDVLGAAREIDLVAPTVPIPLVIAVVLGTVALVATVTTIATRRVLTAAPTRALTIA